MKLSYTTLSVQDKSLREAIEIALRHGLDGIELRGRDNIHLSPQSDAAYRRESRRMLADSGLAIPCLTAYTKFAQADASGAAQQVEALKGYIDLCVQIGARTIRTFMGAYPEGVTADRVNAVIEEGLNLAAECIGDSGIKLVIETHDSMKGGAQLAPVLRAVDPRVGVLLDIIHPFDVGETIGETIRLVGDRIYHVHIKDIYETVPGGRRYSPIGKGIMPVRETIKALSDFGYTDFYSLEWERSAEGTQGVSFEEQLTSFTEFMRGV